MKQILEHLQVAGRLTREEKIECTKSRLKFETGSPEETRNMFIEMSFNSAMSDIQAAISKLEVIKNYLY